MKLYVLGFAFSANKKEIVLIEKQKPDWQKGKLNGIGGKIEPNEVPYLAMVREFEEETGVKTNIADWDLFGEMVFQTDIMGGEAKIYLFRMFNDIIDDCVTKEEEEVLRVNTDTVLSVFSCMHNLPILIPLALSDEFGFTTLKD